MTPLCIALAALATGAGETPDARLFEAPVEIETAGRTFEQTVYPSPAVFDLDGDGAVELYVGDLFGFIQVAHPTPDGWARAKKMKDKSGNDLKFDNW
ncbi:MAG: hypothetical protein AAGH64_01380 [Planctomycetota bacterium]